MTTQPALKVSANLVSVPEGGRIHIVHVPVNPGREWQEAIAAASPNPRNDWEICKVGDHYPPQPGELKDEEIVLVNFGKTIPNVRYAIDWAKQYGLTPKGPRSVFAISEHRLQLHCELNAPSAAIVSPMPCIHGGCRKVSVIWQYCVWLGLFDGEFLGGCWFAFGRE